MVAKYFKSVALWIGINSGVFVSHKDVLHVAYTWSSFDWHVPIEVFDIVLIRADLGFGGDGEGVGIVVQRVCPASNGEFYSLTSWNVAAKSVCNCHRSGRWIVGEDSSCSITTAWGARHFEIVYVVAGHHYAYRHLNHHDALEGHRISNHEFKLVSGSADAKTICSAHYLSWSTRSLLRGRSCQAWTRRLQGLFDQVSICRRIGNGFDTCVNPNLGIDPQPPIKVGGRVAFI